MKLSVHGDNTSHVEVSDISAHGLWLLTHGKKLFMSYDDFPWFKEKTVQSITHVEEPSSGHFYWPELDIDLTKASIENPERFPLKAKIT